MACDYRKQNNSLTNVDMGLHCVDNVFPWLFELYEGT